MTDTPDYPEWCAACLNDTHDLIKVNDSYVWECRDCGTLDVGVDKELVEELPEIT